MKLITNLICFIALGICSVQAQPFYKSYDWDNNPEYSSEGMENESIVTLKEKIVSEFYFEKDNSLTEYVLEHKVIFLNSDEKIEDYNKIYLPYSSNSELEVTKARVINKNGKIINLDKSKILTATDEETQRTYKYFAFEGIEKGSFIEYLYVFKKYPDYDGKRLTLQTDFQKKNVEFDLYAPSNLLFKFKSYNGLKDIEMDTLATEKMHWNLALTEVPALDREDQAAYDANTQFLVYALDRNLANNASGISSYSKISQNIYNYYYEEIPKKTASELDKFIKELKLQKIEGTDAKIRTLERYIKTNFYVADAKNEKLSDLQQILKDKVASESGITKLYIALCNQLGLETQIVFTSPRDYIKFDKDFEASNFLKELLLYFPETKQYLSPGTLQSRYGFPQAELTDNFGLFIKEVALGDFKSAVGKIEYIHPVTANVTADEMNLDVSFNNEDLTETSVHLKELQTGYYALYIHPYLDLMKQEDKDELMENFAKNLDENAEISQKEILNADPKLFGEKPLGFVLDFTSTAFVEKAGNKFLFKVGNLIGPQMELYQEKKRMLPVENQFQRSYVRTITINIPEGYTISNPDDLIIENNFVKDGQELLSFKSSYTIKDNVVTITANEYYRLNIIEVEDYESYRKVINSAADFNKITLVLEPISE